MEPLREAVEAWLQRVKAPILGYALLAVLAFNWKPIWALVFSDKDVFTKFLYFDLKTSYWSLVGGPLLVGLALAIATPWIALAGAYIVWKPTKLQRQLQRDSRVEQEIYHLETQARIENAKAAEEEAREKRTLNEAKRTKVAEQLGPDAVENLRLTRAASKDDETEEKNQLSEIDKFTIRFVGVQPGVVDLSRMSGAIEALPSFRRIFPGATAQRFRTELEASLNRLKSKGLATESLGDWSLTTSGYEQFDQLKD